MQKATVFDVAKLAGVSIRAVSCVVNREPNVVYATQERIGLAIEKLNYEHNQTARNLVSHRLANSQLAKESPGSVTRAAPD